MAKEICAFTSICQEDEQWVDQYLAEVDRLKMDFCIHFDRCNSNLKSRLLTSCFCVGWTAQEDHDVEFTEQHKQGVFNDVVRLGYQWAMAWDIDETYDRDAPEKLKSLKNVQQDMAQTYWVNLWDDPRYVRVDGPFLMSKRIKFYRLGEKKWKFDHPITNGAKAYHDGWPIPTTYAGPGEIGNLTCLHWGMLTKELREQHKERWDRIYGKAVGSNPYGFWQIAVDDSITPILVRHGYF